MFKLELTTEEGADLVKLLSTKLKEIHHWRIATKSQVRDEKYDRLATLLKNITYVKED